MNSLSILLYLAGVAGNIQGTLVFFGIAFIIMMCIWFLMILGADTNRYLIESRKNISRYAKLLIFVPAIIFTVAAFIPSEKTVLLIAASEAGEMAITSEAGAEILLETKNAILSQLQKMQQ